MTFASMPLDQFRDVLHPTEEQAVALDDLGLAAAKATQDNKIACPAEVALTATGRMAAMQRRIEAKDRCGGDRAAATGEVLRSPQ